MIQDINKVQSKVIKRKYVQYIKKGYYSLFAKSA